MVLALKTGLRERKKGNLLLNGYMVNGGNNNTIEDVWFFFPCHYP